MFKWLKNTLEINCNTSPAKQNTLDNEIYIFMIADFCNRMGCIETQKSILSKKTELVQATIIEREKIMKPILQKMYCNLVFAKYDTSNSGILSIFRQTDPHRIQVMEALVSELAMLTMHTKSLTELKKYSAERLKEFITETQKIHEEKSLLGKLGLTESRLVRCLTKFLEKLELTEKDQANANIFKLSINRS